MYEKNGEELLIQNGYQTDYDPSTGKIKIKGDDLKPTNIYAYGIGHVLNDLTATCWFSFLLYYLTDIINLHKNKAGWVMLSGQIFDGIATPLVGIFSDKYNTKIGKRTPWYIGGTLGVIICFSLIFQKCELCKESSSPEFYEMLYYITLPSLFNVAWASVQVSHMALLPSISINKKNRDTMVRVRTAFTFASQMLCLFFSFIIFYMVEDKFKQYSYLSISCVIIGTITSIVFLIFCREVTLSKNINKYYQEMKEALLKSQNTTNNHIEMNPENQNLIPNYNTIENNECRNQTPVSYGVIYWLKKPMFYKYIIIYMLVRLSINVTSSMLPYYLELVLGFKKTNHGGTPVELSLIYLFTTSGCLFNSLYLQKLLEKHNSRPLLMFVAWIFTICGLLPIIFLSYNNTLPIYMLAFTFGIGFALALSTSSSLINDVVGSKGDHGAFVYGAYSLTDKFCSGILLFVFVDLVKDDKMLLKYIIPILPVVAIFLSFIVVSYRRRQSDEEVGGKCKKDLDKSIIDNSKFSFISA
jgi:Na+/melibiose symporter-like transporter